VPEGPEESSLRDRVLHDIQEHPGSSAREIQRRLSTAWGETTYHLERLSKAGLLRRERGGWRDYYFSLELTWLDRRIIQSLRSPAERQLLLAALDRPSSSFAELVDETGLGRSTASFHLRRLVELGRLTVSDPGVNKRYSVVEADRTRELLSQYAASFADELVDRFVDAFGGLLKE
jgi:DNA-binding MarR family transcriptional regulator